MPLDAAAAAAADDAALLELLEELATADPPELLLDPASQLPESCAANGDFFRRSYGELELCLPSDSAAATEVMMAFEDTDDGNEDEDEVPAATEEDVPATWEPEVADDDDDDDEDAVLVLVLFGKLRLLEEEEDADDEDEELLLPLEEAGLAVDDPELAAACNAGPLFCWPAGDAPTFGAGMF